MTIEKFINTNPDFFEDDNLWQDNYKFMMLKSLMESDPKLKDFVFEKDNSIFELINMIGIQNTLKLIDEYPEFVKYILFDEIYCINAFSLQCDKSNSYEEIKKSIYEKFASILTNLDENGPNMSILPTELLEKYSAYFIKDGELPKEVKKHFYRGDLSLDEVREYREVFEQKNLSKHTLYFNIEKVFGSLKEYFDTVPKELDLAISYGLNRYLTDNVLEGWKKIDRNKFLEKTISVSLLAIEPTDLNTIYEYSKYLPLDNIVNREVYKFLNFFGMELLIEFNKNNVFDINLIQALAFGLKNCGELSRELKSKDQHELYTSLIKIIHWLREHSDLSHTRMLNDYATKYSTVFKEEFLDYELLDKILSEYDDESMRATIILLLEQGFGGNINKFLSVINSHPELLPVVNGKNLIIPDNFRELKDFYYSVGNDNFYKFVSLYGNAVPSIVAKSARFIGDYFSIVTNVKREEKKDIDEDAINKFVYDECLKDYRQYDLRDLPASFRNKYPQLFLKDDAPQELQNLFYGIKEGNRWRFLSPADIQNNQEWAKHLTHVNFPRTMRKKAVVFDKNSNFSLYEALYNFFSNEEILDLFINYGEYIWNVDSFVFESNKSKQEIYNIILDTMYSEFVSGRLSYYEEDFPQEFKEKYPAIFLDENAPNELRNLYYSNSLHPVDIRKHPEYKEYLKDKNIKLGFRSDYNNFIESCMNFNIPEIEIMNYIEKYDHYIYDCNVKIKSTEDIEESIQQQIYKSISVDIFYNDDLKPFLGEKYPALFLDDDAPEELKKCFYNIDDYHDLTFEKLKENKEWWPYLKDKNVFRGLRNITEIYNDSRCVIGLDALDMHYGSNELLKFVTKNPESVMAMITNYKTDVLIQWYDKFHFIPHHVVMLNFPFEESDKFLAAGRKWSKIMKLDRYNDEESKAALLKASVCFGVFDNDGEGYNKLIELFCGLPKKISESDYSELLIAVEYCEASSRITKEENSQVNIDNLTQLYRCTTPDYETILNLDVEDLEYALNPEFNNHQCIEEIREICEEVCIPGLITPDMAHKIFGGFEMKYSPSFRDFLLDNLETILESADYIAYISSMQKAWEQIRALNSNRVLTLEHALAFVQSNKYLDVEKGNQKLAVVSNKAGYTEEDFDVLQKIYNYGKIRTFSSIPRVEKTLEKYNYEILRLDDPLAVAIGTLTDCCQEIENTAEMSMEHSMVSKHGRVFVIKDNFGNIVAESWVWRNKNVICFDNIEIPDRAFRRAKNECVSSSDFADCIYKLYETAAKELIEKDEAFYTDLLNRKKITQFQYEVLKLAKVTVGLGYNDIADSLKRNAKLDNSKVARPLVFNPPVELANGLYTSDSQKQYVIAGDMYVKQSTEETPAIYADEFEIYEESNMSFEDFNLLLSLGYINNYYDVDFDEDDEINFFTDIADTYDFEKEKTRIIMNANFAIIYEEHEEEIIIGDILRNKNIYIDSASQNITKKVNMQIKNALHQINPNGKKINVENLDSTASSLYENIMNISEEEIDIEKGLKHARK